VRGITLFLYTITTNLTLFLVLIGNFDQKSNFQPDWPEISLKRQIGPKRGETWYSRVGRRIT